MITLPLPDKILWPNGRGHHMAYARAFKKHKQWAFYATRDVLPYCFKHNGERVKLKYIITPKTKHAIDSDNALAAMKSYQDGIALALSIDDNLFDLPGIVFAEPRKPGGVEVIMTSLSPELSTSCGRDDFSRSLEAGDSIDLMGVAFERRAT